MKRRQRKCRCYMTDADEALAIKREAAVEAWRERWPELLPVVSAFRKLARAWATDHETSLRQACAWFAGCYGDFCECCGGYATGYMIRDELWRFVAGRKRILCLPCVERRLGRKLEPQDFEPCELNADWQAENEQILGRKPGTFARKQESNQ